MSTILQNGICQSHRDKTIHRKQNLQNEPLLIDYQLIITVIMTKIQDDELPAKQIHTVTLLIHVDHMQWVT